MTLIDIWNTLVAGIHSIGWIWLIIMIVVDVILWKIHPILGTLGTLFILAVLFGFITF